MREQVAQGVANPVEEHRPIEQPRLAGCDLVRAEVEKYDWDAKIMLAIAHAESNCREDAVGDTHITYEANGRRYGYSVGVFQIRILEGREDCDTHDVIKNVECAYRIWLSQSYRAWSVFTNGRYIKFLGV